ncbi:MULTISPECIES: hypothetical protein [unclassified Streptomyces]|uniref:hypothetical protein n=1 Tax=unclassified Streptomyces TaxID=2593676 RepID=UPI0036FDCF21
MDPLILAAGTALVSAMATDAWQRASTGVVTLWRKARNADGDPVDVDHVSRELALLRDEAVRASTAADTRRREELEAVWTVRLHALVSQNPELVPEVRALLREHLLPAAGPDDRPRIDTLVKQNVKASGGTVYVAGRDMTVGPGDSAP